MRIAFYKGTGFFSKAVLFFSRGGYSHCSVLFDDGTIIEANPFVGVRRCDSITEKLDTNIVIDIFEVKTTKKQDKIIKTFLEKQVGKGYDYAAILGFILYASEDGRRKYARWICSELVFAAFRKAGVNLLERANAWKVSPTILSYNTVMKLDDTINFKI